MGVLARELKEDDRPGSQALLDGWLALVAAIVRKACVDARKDDLYAARWLKSEVCEMFCEFLEIDRYEVIKFADEIIADIEIDKAYAVPTFESNYAQLSLIGA